MRIEQDFLYWKLIDLLLADNKFRLVNLSQDQKEAWLEPRGSREFQLVRISRNDIDWANMLVQDAERNARLFEEVRKQSGFRSLNVLNLYILDEEPVDDWDELNKPVSFEKTALKTMLVTRDNKAKLLSDLSHIVKRDVTAAESAGENGGSPEDLEALKANILNRANQSVQEEQKIFDYGKPFFTYVFIAIQVVMFLLLELSGGSTNSETLLRFGAKYNPLIESGEWWRLVTPIFLHIGVFHLLLNTMALYYVGMAAEKMYGSLRFFLIYLFAGIGGSLASYAFNPGLSAGASGAIFGCFGALLYLAIHDRQLFFRTIGPNIIVVILLNLVLGFSISNIDNSGHIGGLIGGFLAAMIAQLPGKNRSGLRLAGIIGAAVFIGGLIFYSPGISASASPEGALVKANQLLNEKKYEEASDVLKEAKNSSGANANVLFQLSYAEINLKEYDSAAANLEQAIKLDPKMDQAYFNLGLLYMRNKELDKAQQMFSKAAELKPDDKMYAEQKKIADQLK